MRGEVWVIAASKPRPAVIVQNNQCETADTVLVCPLTTFDAGGDDCILPTEANGLAKPSRPMAHRTVAVKKSRLGELVGMLSEEEMALVSEQLRFAFGL